MFKRNALGLFVATLAILLSMAGVGSGALAQSGGDAAKSAKVAVLPFEVNAEKELDYLRDNIPQLIMDRLREKGGQTTDLGDVYRAIRERRVDRLDLATARDLALALGADYAVYGVLSQVGESLSFDVRLVDASGKRQPTPITVVKEGIINILPAADELAEKIRQSLLAGEKIIAFDVEGNDALEKDVVLSRLRLQAGDPYDPKAVNEDLKRVYALGYFDDVQVRLEDAGAGKRLVFVVKEKPRVQAVGFKGNEVFDSDELAKAMGIKTGAVMNPKTLAEDLNKIRDMYRKKGYYNVEVSHQIEQADARTARLTVNVKEGKKLYIRNITISGAKEISESELKGQLALAERGIISWLTGSGVLDEDKLERDAAAIEAYYGNRGYMDAKAGKPKVDFQEDGISITFFVTEGARYKLGKVDYTGDLIKPAEELKAVTRLDDLAAKGEYFDRSVLREDLQRLTEFYTDFGYAYAEADMKLDKDEKSRVVGVTYLMNRQQKVHVRRVIIEGNDKTRDNVIRRQMRLSDGEQFSGAKLRRSNERLNKMDYFEKVEIEPATTGNPSELDLKVKVKEKATGQMSAGAGYSSFIGPFFTGSISERNLFGKGYELGFSGTISGKSNLYMISFTNPSVYDSFLSAGMDIYSRNDEYYTYEKDTVGGRLRFGYPVGEYSRLFWSYRLDHYDIKEVDDDASDTIKELQGGRIASVGSVSIQRDTTDRRINPNKGSNNTLTVDYAGGALGGDDSFIRYVFDTSWYWPLWRDLIFHWHAQAGYVMENFGGDDVPDYEKFYLGGMNSVRGYDTRRICPRDENDERIGGDKELFANFELLFPLYKEMGIMGLFFFDAGNSWDTEESYSLDLYKSVGTGIRWYSPMGPLRLEVGYALDELEGGGDKYKVEFSVGQFF